MLCWEVPTEGWAVGPTMGRAPLPGPGCVVGPGAHLFRPAGQEAGRLWQSEERPRGDAGGDPSKERVGCPAQSFR